METWTTNPHQTNRLRKTCREPRRNIRPSSSRATQCFPPEAASRARSILFRLARPSFFYRFSSRYYYRRWHRIISPRDITWKIAKSEKVARREIIMHECIRGIKCWKTFWHDGWSRIRRQKSETVSRRGDTFAIEFVYRCSKHAQNVWFS